jgi:hypothetical protein
MIQRRAKAGGITTQVGNHTFRATGVTAYLKNGGTLEKAAQMANHASTHDAALRPPRRGSHLPFDGKRPIWVVSTCCSTPNDNRHAHSWSLPGLRK